MPSNGLMLSAIVRHFSELRVLVIGDPILDLYYEGRATTLCPYGPVPVVRAQHKELLPGGAANVAANTRALGGQVSLLGVIGADFYGDALRLELEQRGVNTSWLVVDETRCTTTKLWLVADGYLVARFDEEADYALGGEAERQLMAGLNGLYERSDVVIVSDYLKGTITPRVLARLNRLAVTSPRVLVVDCKNLARHRYRSVTAVTPNLNEAKAVCNGKVRDISSDPLYWERLGRMLLERVDSRYVVLTLAEEGAVLFERDRAPIHVAVPEVERAHAIGAGDTLAAAFGLALGAGAGPRQAIDIAVQAAVLAVQKERTATTGAEELLRHLAPGERYHELASVSAGMAG